MAWSPPETGGTAHKRLVTKQQEVILRMLVRGGPVSVDRIASVLWSDSIDGPPRSAIRTIRVQIHYMRQALAPYGIRIRTCFGDGYLVENADRSKARDLLREMPLVRTRGRQPKRRAA